MFAFPGHSMFSDPWGASQQQLRFPDATFGMPWGCDTADGFYSPHSRAPRHPSRRTSPEQIFHRAVPGAQELPRQQQSSRKHPSAQPEPLPRKAKQQQQRVPQQAAPQSTGSSTSCSSYSTASDDTSEPMDVCSCPTTPPPTANSSYNSAASGSSPSVAAASPQQQKQEEASSKSVAHPAARQQQQKPTKACRNSNRSSSSMTPQAAATVIQAAWRMSRLARHRPALQQLAAAASQLRNTRTQLAAATAAAVAAGASITQKQYLELSEPVMKVLFLLDAVSCGSAVELRSLRKRLSSQANALLDEIQAAYKALPTAPAPVVQQQQQQQQQQKSKRQQRRPATSSSYQRLRRLAGYN